MDLNSKTLHEVTFGAKVRGYDPAEVDEFIQAVAEGVDELQERLRRATERATRAEQQLANADATAPAPAVESMQAPVAAPAPASASSDLARVWERAAAAAEAAMAEAQQDAQRLLDQARSEAEQTTTRANSEASQTTTKANSEASEVTSKAQREAARVAEEAQAQLRADISQLEAARGQLRKAVDELSGYLDNEKSRLRAAIVGALSALDDYGSGAAPPPEVDHVQVPDAPVLPAPDRSVAKDVSGNTWQSYQESHDQQSPAPEPQLQAPQEAALEVTDVAVTPDEPKKSSWGWDEPSGGQQRSREPGGEQMTNGASSDDHTNGDGEADPFLAELRRAVQDDGPLGPRDDDGNSIDSLYAEDETEDDKSGFFRRKK